MFLFLGGIIVIIGLLLFLYNFELLPGTFGQAFLPVMLIFLGIYLILLSQRIRLFWKGFWFNKFINKK